jgi:tetratricopeptide (TPR) repeat protein/tRNA A-37 threonylcarbamoyl transferase component Bud32
MEEEDSMISDPAESIARNARGLGDPALRRAYLDQACGGDERLRAEVDRLLAAQTQGLELFFDDLPGEKAGDVIGRYTLVEELGHGGFGTVWMADQQEPVKRRVALKILNLGVDTRQVVARFEQERQALALMDHKNVARVLDAGATATGRPYFVMDLVEGEPIGAYCDKRLLTIDARLELFMQVCNAVQHAHGRGIIHRDLKPSNILVSTQDGVPHATVIDFGIAKATSQKLTDKSLLTAQHQVVGTVLYMSPEQAEGSLDIDTRTDVYSLGAVLYELLTGATPFNKDTVEHAMFHVVQRLICEVEPPKPSSRITQSEDTLASVAATRRVSPARLGALVRGELDWIVMKALEKERSRRYESASGLARDIAAYLRNEAVVAAPPSAFYRLRKFVRRNRVTVASVIAVTVALVIGVIGFAWQANVARGQRDRAMFAEGETARRAGELKKVADYQARMLQEIDVAKAGFDLMADLRARHGAALEKGRLPEAETSARKAAFQRELHAVNGTDVAVALLVRTVIAPAVRTIETQFADQPLVDAALRTTLGVVYQRLGRNEEALALHERAFALRANSLGEENPDTLASRYGIGKSLGEMQKLVEAEVAVRATLKGYERALGEDHESTLATRSLLATQLHFQGRYEESEALIRDVLERRRRLLGPEDPRTLDTMSELGMFLRNRGKWADAETVLRAAVESQRRVAPASVIASLSSLGVVLQSQHQYAAAEPYLQEALERSRRDRGEDHPSTVIHLHNLATLLMDAGKLAEAEAAASEALQKSRELRGDEHSETLKALSVMGIVSSRRGRAAEAERYYRESIETGRRVLGEEHPDTIVWTANLGFLLKDLGRLDEAEESLRDALDKNSRKMGEAHPHTLTLVSNLADLLLKQRKVDEAEPHLRRAVEAIRRDGAWNDPQTATLIRHLTDLLRWRGKVTEAEAYLREGLERVGRPGREDAAGTLVLMGSLGACLRDQGRLGDAEPYFQKIMETTRRLKGDEHADTLVAVLRMASLRVAQGRHAEVLALLTPIEMKVENAFPAGIGVVRRASLLGFLGKARAGLARQSAEYAVAEANLLEAHAIFAKSFGERFKETRDCAQALSDFYAAWDGHAPGSGYDAKSAEWKGRADAGPESR